MAELNFKLCTMLFQFVIIEGYRWPSAVPHDLQVSFGAVDAAPSWMQVVIASENSRARVDCDGLTVNRSGRVALYGWDEMPRFDGRVRLDDVSDFKSMWWEIRELRLNDLPPEHAWASLYIPGIMLFWLWNGQHWYAKWLSFTR